MVVRLVRLAAAGSSTDVNTVHIGNEPNNFMWKYSNCSSTDASCALWEEFYSAAALTLKRELPGVRIGGPVLCWGPSGYNQLDQPDWYTWFLWSRPTIERGLREKTLDFFDFRAYTSDSLANRRWQTFIRLLPWAVRAQAGVCSCRPPSLRRASCCLRALLGGESTLTCGRCR